MISDAKGTENYTRSEMEFYDYPGKFKEKSDGERYAKVQLQAEQALDRRRRGNGDAVSLFPGGLTKLEKHPKDSQNVEYLVVRAIAFVLDRIVSHRRSERRRAARLFRQLRVPAERPAVPRADRDAEAKDQRRPDRQGRDQGRQFERGDRRREPRRNLCPVLLGPKEEAVVPVARRAGLVRQEMGRSDHSARRTGSRRRISGRAIPTGLWSSAPSTTTNTSRPTICRPRRRSRD